MSGTYNLKCPKCGFEFEFYYDSLNSFSSQVPGLVFREGSHAFSVKCPRCRKRTHYHVDDTGMAIGKP